MTTLWGVSPRSRTWPRCREPSRRGVSALRASIADASEKEGLTKKQARLLLIAAPSWVRGGSEKQACDEPMNCARVRLRSRCLLRAA